MKEHDLKQLEGDIDQALETASRLGLEMVAYILTMAKLELANEIGDRKLMRLFDQKAAPALH
jgi:hypothetical protein